MVCGCGGFFFFFFNDTATTEIYTLSLHDALPILGRPTLPAGDGLWLPASNGIHMMFMRFPIDAVFVSKPGADGARTVKSVHRNLRAWTGLVPLVRGADGVLELPVGTIDASGTAVGDRVEVLAER